MHICIDICLYAFVHIYTCIHCTFMYLCICNTGNLCVWIAICIKCGCVCTHVSICVCARMYVHAYMHAYAYAYPYDDAAAIPNIPSNMIVSRIRASVPSHIEVFKNQGRYIDPEYCGLVIRTPTKTATGLWKQLNGPAGCKSRLLRSGRPWLPQ